METNELRIQLAIHAPPMPDWFRATWPIGEGLGTIEELRLRLAQWPWAYADGVIAEMEKGVK